MKSVTYRFVDLIAKGHADNALAAINAAAAPVLAQLLYALEAVARHRPRPGDEWVPVVEALAGLAGRKMYEVKPEQLASLARSLWQSNLRADHPLWGGLGTQACRVQAYIKPSDAAYLGMLFSENKQPQAATAMLQRALAKLDELEPQAVLWLIQHGARPDGLTEAELDTVVARAVSEKIAPGLKTDQLYHIVMPEFLNSRHRAVLLRELAQRVEVQDSRAHSRMIWLALELEDTETARGLLVEYEKRGRSKTLETWGAVQALEVADKVGPVDPDLIRGLLEHCARAVWENGIGIRDVARALQNLIPFRELERAGPLMAGLVDAMEARFHLEDFRGNPAGTGATGLWALGIFQARKQAPRLVRQFLEMFGSVNPNHLLNLQGLCAGLRGIDLLNIPDEKGMPREGSLRVPFGIVNSAHFGGNPPKGQTLHDALKALRRHCPARRPVRTVLLNAAREVLNPQGFEPLYWELALTLAQTGRKEHPELKSQVVKFLSGKKTTMVGRLQLLQHVALLRIAVHGKNWEDAEHFASQVEQADRALATGMSPGNLALLVSAWDDFARLTKSRGKWPKVVREAMARVKGAVQGGRIKNRFIWAAILQMGTTLKKRKLLKQELGLELAESASAVLVENPSWRLAVHLVQFIERHFRDDSGAAAMKAAAMSLLWRDYDNIAGKLQRRIEKHTD